VPGAAREVASGASFEHGPTTATIVLQPDALAFSKGIGDLV
jgi:hypothetical protein